MALETVEFTFGDEVVKVPVFSFWDLEVCQPRISALNPELTMLKYAHQVMELVAHLVDPDNESTHAAMILKWKKQCSIPQMNDLPYRMGELLRASGFLMGEAQAAQEESPGTGTSTAASPNSQFEEFAEETRGALSGK